MADESRIQPKTSVLGSMQTFVAFVSAVVGVIAAAQALSSKTAADQSARDAAVFKQQLERQANDRAEREIKAKFDSVAYEAVVKVLEMDRGKLPRDVPEKRERAVLALIAATASESMQTALFDVVRTGPDVTASVKKDAGQAADILRDFGSLASDAVSAPLATPAVSKPADGGTLRESLTGYRVVVFYCQNSSNPQAADLQRLVAEKLVSELRSAASATALRIAWETKELPEILNSAPGYKIFTNQIRFNPADNEESPSIALKKILESTSTLQASKASVERRTVSKRTPNYLSVFLCGLQTPK